MAANPKVIESETALVPYSLEAAVIEGLKTKYLDVTIPADDRAAYSMVMSGLRECRDIRLAVDAWHKDKKEDIIRAGKHYDSERRRIHALVEPIESHLAAVRKAEDDRKEAIKAEAERKERERVEKIRAKIAEISLKLIDTQGKTAAEILAMMEALGAQKVTEAEFGEFTLEAARTMTETMEALARSRQSREKWENEQAAAKAEAERLEKIRQEQETEAKRIKAEKDAIEAEKKALEDAKRKEQESKEREELKKKLAEEARIKAEADAKAKAEREAKEAELKAQREAEEAARKAALRPDKEQILWYARSIRNYERPELKDEAAKQIFNASIIALEKWAKKLIGQAEAL